MKKSISNIHSNAFKFAYQVKSFFKSWGDALRCGWMLAKLFLGRKVELTFNKVNKKTGEVTPRKAVALTIGSIKTIERGVIKVVEEIQTGVQWRSFRFENLIFN